jgi:hypothetical protein
MGNALNNAGVKGGDGAQSLKAFGTAGFGGVPPPDSTQVRTAGQPAAGTAALREQFTLPNVAEIAQHVGALEKLGNAANQQQSLLYAE